MVNRAALRDRPRIQRLLIRSWDYTPAIRPILLGLRLLGVLCLLVIGIALLTISDWWGAALLVLAIAALPLSFWVFSNTATAPISNTATAPTHP